MTAYVIAAKGTDRDGAAIIHCDALCDASFTVNMQGAHKTRVRAERAGWRVGTFHDRRDFCPTHATRNERTETP